METLDGILPVYKEAGLTSHDVIYHLRRILGRQKIGHTGTLDPMASGLLMICMGRATKLTQFLTDWDKCYLGEITLGKTSDTLDADGDIVEGEAIPEMTVADVEKILRDFVGTIEQKVPSFSAVKVRGKELYKYARKGVAVKTPTRQVEIKNIELVSYRKPVVEIMVTCGKGTYIRALADDIGRKIGCGAYLSKLERLRVGSHSVESSLTIKEVEKLFKAGQLHHSILPMIEVLPFPRINVRNSAVGTIRNGGIPPVDEIIDFTGDFANGDFISMADERGKILAIGKSKCDNASLHEIANSNEDYFSYVRVLI